MEIEEYFYMGKITKMPIEGKVSQEFVKTVAMQITEDQIHHIASHGLAENMRNPIELWYKLDRTKSVPSNSWYYNIIRKEVALSSNDYTQLEYCIAIVDSNNPSLKMKGESKPSETDVMQMAIFNEFSAL